MHNKIIILNSIAGAGKDTAADYLTEKYHFQKFAFADGIKEIAKEYFGVTHKDRGLYIKIGEKMREINPNVWVDYTLKRSMNIQHAVIADCRQEREYYRAVMNGFLPIRITCNKEEAIKRILLRDGYCDRDLLELPTEIGTRDMAALNVNNNGSIYNLCVQIDDIMEQNWDNYMQILQYNLKCDTFFRQYAS